MGHDWTSCRGLAFLPVFRHACVFNNNQPVFSLACDPPLLPIIWGRSTSSTQQIARPTTNLRSATCRNIAILHKIRTYRNPITKWTSGILKLGKHRKKLVALVAPFGRIGTIGVVRARRICVDPQVSCLTEKTRRVLLGVLLRRGTSFFMCTIEKVIREWKVMRPCRTNFARASLHALEILFLAWRQQLSIDAELKIGKVCM